MAEPLPLPTLHFCSPCAGESWFEVVVFEDGLGDESERACVDCGHAIVVGVLVDLVVDVPLAA